MTPATLAKQQVRPATMQDRGFRDRPASHLSLDVASESPSTFEEDHVGSLLNNLEGAINDLQGLQSRLSRRLVDVLSKTARMITEDHIKHASYIGFSRDARRVAAEASLIDGVRFAHAVDEHTIAFSATPEGAKRLSFAFDVTAYCDKESAEENPSHPRLKAENDSERPWWSDLGEKHSEADDSYGTDVFARAARCAQKLHWHYANVPGVFGIEASADGKVIVSTDSRFPRDARIAMRKIAKPHDVVCEFRSS
jgi:hypothetical protein